jgi:hypothetical protein
MFVLIFIPFWSLLLFKNLNPGNTQAVLGESFSVWMTLQGVFAQRAQACVATQLSAAVDATLAALQSAPSELPVTDEGTLAAQGLTQDAVARADVFAERFESWGNSFFFLVS